MLHKVIADVFLHEDAIGRLAGGMGLIGKQEQIIRFARLNQGIDRGGCANVLTRGAHSPGGAAVHNTGLVQVEKV